MSEAVALVQRVALDRETKMQILTLLAVNPDPRIVDDVTTLLRSYEEMDVAEREALKGKLVAIDAAYQAKLDATDGALERDMKAMQDEIGRNDEIERIRQSLT